MSEQTMTSTTELIQEDDLVARFPQNVSQDERQGYEGYIVQPDHLIEVAATLRDEMGYDFLSSVTGVDYFPDDLMEVVYHAYRTTGGPAMVFKTQVPREDPVVPSLVPLYP